MKENTNTFLEFDLYQVKKSTPNAFLTIKFLLVDEHSNTNTI